MEEKIQYFEYSKWEDHHKNIEYINSHRFNLKTIFMEIKSVNMKTLVEIELFIRHPF